MVKKLKRRDRKREVTGVPRISFVYKLPILVYKMLFCQNPYLRRKYHFFPVDLFFRGEGGGMRHNCKADSKLLFSK